MNDPTPTPPTSWSSYQRKGLSEMRPYLLGEELSLVSISEADRLNGSPKLGDMIARNPKNHADQWLVAEKYFLDNLEPAVTPPATLAETPTPPKFMNDKELVAYMDKQLTVSLAREAELLREIEHVKACVHEWKTAWKEKTIDVENLHQRLEAVDKERDYEKKLRETACLDWAHDDTELKKIAERHGIKTEGDRWGFKDRMECVEEMSQLLTAEREKVKALETAAKDASSKIHDAAAGKINWREDFAYRIDLALAALTPATEEGKG